MVLGNEGSEFIVSDGKSIYQTGKQIIATKLTTKAGEEIQRLQQSLTLNDQDVVPALQQLMNAHPGKDIYLSGSITIDFPEEVQTVSDPKQLETIAIAGETVTLKYHPIEQAIPQLNDQWATGSITALILE